MISGSGPGRQTASIAALLALCIASPCRAGATADSVSTLRALVQSRRYADAEARSRRWLDELQVRAGADTARAASLEVLLEVMLAEGHWTYPDARDIGARAVLAKQLVYGSESPEAGICRITFARLLYRAGDWESARAQAEQGLALCERAYGPWHRSVMRGLQYLANILEEQAEFAPAERLYQRATAVAESVSGRSSADLGNVLNSLAVMYKKTGRLSEARPLYERALAIRESSFGPESPELVFNLNNLANLYIQTGSAQRARRLYERDLAILDRSEGPRHPFYAQVLANLASAELAIADTVSALAALQRSLEIRRAAVGEDHPDLAFALDDLGVIWTATGDTTRARAALDRALAIRMKSYGPDHPEVAKVIEHLGDLALATGAIGEATTRFSRALEMRKRSFGGSSRDVAESQIGLATALRRSGDDAGALDLAIRGEENAAGHLRLTARVLEERIALDYEATRPSGISLALSIAADHSRDPGVAAMAWDALIRSRGLVLDEMARRQRVVVSHPDQTTAALADSLRQADEQLAWLVSWGTDTTLASRQQRAQAAERKERCEFSLAVRSSEFRRLEAAKGAGLADVAHAVGAGELLVAFARYTAMPGGERGTAVLRGMPVGSHVRYIALVMRGGDSLVHAVSVGAADDIDSLVAAWHRAASQRPSVMRRAADEARCRWLGQALRQRVWDPLADWSARARRIIVVPDGALQLVNFSALPGMRLPYLIDEGLSFHLISAERDLAAGRERAPAGQGLLVLGNPAFDAATDRSAASPMPAPGRDGESRLRGTTHAAPAVRHNPDASRAPTSGCEDFRSLSFGPLPESAHEAIEAAAMWRAGGLAAASADSAVVLMLGARASESQFRLLAPGRRWIHIATHGFFLGDDCAAAAGRRNAGSTGGADSLALENPLLRSGLALAGANRRGRATRGADDGILTADEIAKLDLSGVECAILSACETARGDILAGEGVLGLRRGFQIAGAQTLVMSLWAVDDASAHAWMRAFYRARLARGQGAAQAMDAAGLEVLGTRRAAGASTHPFYWAGFVASGDWR